MVTKLLRQLGVMTTYTCPEQDLNRVFPERSIMAAQIVAQQIPSAPFRKEHDQEPEEYARQVADRHVEQYRVAAMQPKQDRLQHRPSKDAHDRFVAPGKHSHHRADRKHAEDRMK